MLNSEILDILTAIQEISCRYSRECAVV